MLSLEEFQSANTEETGISVYSAAFADPTRLHDADCCRPNLYRKPSRLMRHRTKCEGLGGVRVFLPNELDGEMAGPPVDGGAAGEVTSAAAC